MLAVKNPELGIYYSPTSMAKIISKIYFVISITYFLRAKKRPTSNTTQYINLIKAMVSRKAATQRTIKTCINLPG
jgi:hypothetical protein